MLENAILKEAERLGFAAVGIADAGPAASSAEFRQWIESGRAADMQYLARSIDLRADPRRLMPECVSIIVAAASYPVNRNPGKGISTFARGYDYHDVIRSKLLMLRRFIENNCADRLIARVCVDSAPLPEREWAARAGLGWIGRQGQLVNPNLGSCLLLGELLVNVKLEPTIPRGTGADEYMPDRCGDCRLCVDACPTGAIGPDRHVDARRCLSYLTIERRTAIPENIRAAMGETLFGCDLCTAICPWNRSCAENVMPELIERPLPAAAEYASMSELEFRSKCAGASMLRTGLAQMRRNAQIALDNAANRQEMPERTDQSSPLSTRRTEQ